MRTTVHFSPALFHVFAVHGINQAGKPERVRLDVRRAKLLNSSPVSPQAFSWE